MRLDHTTVFRGGASQRWRHYENRDCRVSSDGSHLNLETQLASKGGGRTGVLIAIGVEDVPDLLTLIATKVPGSALMLAAAAHEAAKASQDAVTASRDSIAAAADAMETVLDGTERRYLDVAWSTDDAAVLRASEECDAASTVQAHLRAARWTASQA